MDFFSRILQPDAISTGLVILAVAVVAGLVLGAARVRGVGLGVAAVLFAGLGMGALGFRVNDSALKFMKDFSLIIFIYAVGLQVGPGFVAAFKSDGLRMNLLSAVVLLLGALLTVAVVVGSKLPGTLAPGLYTGAFSSTPAFAAGQEALVDRLRDAPGVSSRAADAVRTNGVVFAVTYPIGVLGPILLIIALRWAFHVDIGAERAALEQTHDTPHPAHVHPLHHHGDLSRARLLVTRPDALGKMLAELDLAGRFRLSITEVHRAGLELPARSSLRVQFADHLHVVGPRDGIHAAEAAVGNSMSALKHPQLLPIFVGIVLGVIAGSIPFKFPGLHSSVKLGLAGGPMIVAILLSRLGQFGSLVWYMPAAASNLFRDFGIALFLACTGLESGGQVAKILISSEGLTYVAWGALITMLPITLVAIFARIGLKMNFLRLSGLICGAMTSTPTMLFANEFTGSDEPSVVFASVYPLGMLIPVFAAQWLAMALG